MKTRTPTLAELSPGLEPKDIEYLRQAPYDDPAAFNGPKRARAENLVIMDLLERDPGGTLYRRTIKGDYVIRKWGVFLRKLKKSGLCG